MSGHLASNLLVKVGALHSIDADVPAFRPTHLLGILDPSTPEPAIYEHEFAAHETLVLRFHDVDTEQPSGPTTENVGAILAFIDKVLAFRRIAPARLFVHCHAGISRSTASAYIAFARDLGVDRAAEAFEALLGVRVYPWPNRLIVSIADRLLGANGRLLAPLDAYRAANLHRLEDMMAHHRGLVGLEPLDDL